MPRWTIVPFRIQGWQFSVQFDNAGVEAPKVVDAVTVEELTRRTLQYIMRKDA